MRIVLSTAQPDDWALLTYDDVSGTKNNRGSSLYVNHTTHPPQKRCERLVPKTLIRSHQYTITQHQDLSGKVLRRTLLNSQWSGSKLPSQSHNGSLNGSGSSTDQSDYVSDTTTRHSTWKPKTQHQCYRKKFNLSVSS